MARNERLSRRRFLSAGSALAGATLLAACSQTTAPATNPPATAPPATNAPANTPATAPTTAPQPTVASNPAASGAPVEITWETTPLWPLGASGSKADAPEDEWPKDAITRFQKDHPEIKVNLQLDPFSSVGQKLNTQYASQSWPNIIYGNPSLPHVHSGIVVALDDVVTADDLKDIADGYWVGMVINGKRYGWPMFCDPDVFGVNLSLFLKDKKADNLLPSTDKRQWSWDQFVEAAKAVSGGTGANQTYALGIAGNGQYYWSMGWIPQSFGGKFWNDDETKVLIDQPEYIAGLEFMLKLQNDYKVIPPGLPGSSDIGQYYNDKRIAIRYGETSLDHTIATGVQTGKIKGPFEMYYVNQPYQDGVPPKVEFGGLSPGVGYFVMVDKDAHKVDASKTFVHWLGNTENNKSWTQAGYLPVRVSSRQGLYADNANLSWSTGPLLELPFEQSLYHPTKNLAAATVVGQDTFGNVLGQALQETLLGKSSAKDALTAAAKTLNDAIVKASNS